MHVLTIEGIFLRTFENYKLMENVEENELRELFDYLIHNASFIVNKDLKHFERTGFVIALEGFSIQIPSVMLNYNIFRALMLTYKHNIDGELYINAWLDEHELKFNFNISIIDSEIESAMDKAEQKREGSLRPLTFYRIKRIEK